MDPNLGAQCLGEDAVMGFPTEEDEAVNQAEREARVAEERARNRRREAELMRDEAGSSHADEEEESEVTPSQLERGEGGSGAHHGHQVGVTRKLGGNDRA